MPRWFRHEATLRNDPAVMQLAKEFGPIGEVIWTRLLELHCQNDGPFTTTVDGLALNLALRPEWNADLEGWLKRASQLNLISLRKKKHEVMLIEVRAWQKFHPTHNSAEYEREKKRRQRAGMSPGTNGDIKGTSNGVPACPAPTVRNDTDVTGRDETSLSVIDTFDEFWDVFPRKVGKTDARKSWDKRLGEGVSPEDLIAGARRYAEWVAAGAVESKRFVCHPATWLNQGRESDVLDDPAEMRGTRAPPPEPKGYASLRAVDDAIEGRDRDLRGVEVDSSGATRRLPAPSDTA